MIVHTIGDSHAVNGWTDVAKHTLGPLLCYSFGRDPTGRCPNLTALGVRDGDIVIFCLGEIDCRCQIGKRGGPDTVPPIVERYLQGVVSLVKASGLKRVKPYVYSVPPPPRKEESRDYSDYPLVGSNEERLAITTRFNAELRVMSWKSGIGFMDVSTACSVGEGYLNPEMSDGHVHINDTRPITDALFDVRLRHAAESAFTQYVDKPLTSSKLRYLTFASEGSPHDEGRNLVDDAEKLARTVRQGCQGFEEIKVWTPRKIHEEIPDSTWCTQSYDDNAVVTGTGFVNNPGFHKVGLGSWKSVIIDNMMDKSAEGDVVIYQDGRDDPYCSPLPLARRLREYAMRVLQETDFFMPIHAVPLCRGTPREVAEKLIPDHELAARIMHAPVPRARIIVIRVTRQTRLFIKSYVEVSKRLDIVLSRDRRTYPECTVYFSHFNPEQTNLNVIGYRDGVLPLNWAGTWVEKWSGTADETGMGVNRILSGH